MKTEKKPSGKLLRIIRSIAVHNKNDEQVNEIDIDVPLEILKEIVVANEDDPLLYDGYELDVVQLNKLNNYLIDKLVVDLNHYSYFLIAGGIYDWQSDRD